MRRSSFAGFSFLFSAMVAGGCGGVEITPGSGGGGAGSSSTSGSSSSASSSGGSTGSGGSGGSSTTGASQSSSTAVSSSSTGPAPGECVIDNDCALGSICVASACVPGCSATQACTPGETCCGGACTKLDTDVAHCGACDNNCPVPPNAVASCQNGVCGEGPCDAGHADCNFNKFDGCEHNVLTDGPCVCAPGSTMACYLGFPGTENTGPCKVGSRTCQPDGAGFGACVGQVLPISEICGNGVDDDCNGAVDDVIDVDGDGWTRCDGDCCEVGSPKCPNPQLVNPGAYEIFGNLIDDDCDPTTGDLVPAPSCASAEVLSGVTGVEVAKAMDLCQFTTANLPLAQRRWGVLAASQILPDGSAPTAADLADIQGYQTAVLTSFGSVITPHKNETMAALSTGRMRDAAHPGYVDPSPGTSFGRVGAPPPAFLAAHGGLLPSSSGCNGACPNGSGANDGVNVRLTIRVPTNAKFFSYDYRYFTGEYGARRCSSFNDYHLALYQTSSPGIPLDHNIALDTVLHLPSVDSAFFDVCSAQGCSLCPFGPGNLSGTGFDVGGLGAATQWLTVDAPIVAGETIQLDLMVFDVSDGAGDSAVLLDNFRWGSAAGCPNCGG
jgi:hypothetical protein